jgi:hypothetical protein
VSHDVIQSKSDWFSPIALYKSNSSGDLAVEGTLTKAGKQTGHHVYIVIPQKVLVAAHLQTKGDVSFQDIGLLSPQVRQELHLQKKLGLDYEKIVCIPSPQGGMSMNERHTLNIQATVKAVGMLPFAFAIDAITFPLQIYVAKELREHPIQ